MNKARYIDKYCTGCGLCKAQNDTDFIINNEGFPNVKMNDVQATSFFESVCPVFYYSKDIKSDIWGNIEQAFVGYSSNPDIRFKAASGGAITALCIFLLESQKVNGIIHTTYNPEDPTKTMTVVSCTKKELINRCSSRYSISSPLENINTLIDSNKKYAFVGKPCDVMALRNYYSINEAIQNNIILLISFFCAGEPSVKAQNDLLRAMGCNYEDCKSITYRGNGWPGFTTVETKDGNTFKMDYCVAWGNYLGRNLRTICRYCMDGTGDRADIVCADFWHLTENNAPDFSEHEGRNIIISRNGIGNSIINECIKNGYLTIESNFTDKFSKFYLYQPAQYLRKGTMSSKIMALRLFKKEVPQYSKSLLKRYAKHIALNKKIRFFIGTVKRIFAKKI